MASRRKPGPRAGKARPGAPRGQRGLLARLEKGLRASGWSLSGSRSGAEVFLRSLGKRKAEAMALRMEARQRAGKRRP